MSLMRGQLFGGALFAGKLLASDMDNNELPVHMTFLDGGGSLARMLRTPKYVRKQRKDEECLFTTGVL